MAYAFSSILQSADGSAGRDKADVRPVPDLATHLPALEWNNVKNVVIALQQRFGLAPANQALPDVDTLAALDRFVSTPLSSRFRVFDDFLLGDVGNAATIVHNIAVTGAGSGGFGLAVNAGDGAGHIFLSTTGVAGTAMYSHTLAETISMRHSPVSVEFKFKTPTDMTGADSFLGLRNTANTSRIQFGWDHTTQGKVYVASATGGGNGTKNIQIMAPATWYVVKLVAYDNNRVEVYINGSLVDQFNTVGTALPRAGDLFVPFRADTTRVAAAATVLVDWFVTEGVRL